MKHILSFDIAKGKSVYCFIDELKNVIIDATLIEHNKNDFDNLFNLVKDYSNLTVIMESTSIYHLPVENYFRSKGIDTIVKTTTLNDYNFITTLNQYDTVLKQTTDGSTIKEICKQVLSKYKEV